MHTPARLRSLFVALVLAVLAALLPGAAALAADTAQITGKVLGAGLGDVTVVATPSVGERSFSDQTKSDGSYDVAGLPAGSYRVFFQDNSGTHASEWYDGVYTYDAATVISVVEGQSKTLKDASLAATGSITGKVTGDGGAALAGVNVNASWCRNSYAGDPQCTSRRWVSTGSDGTFNLTGLPAGSYRIEYSDPSGNYASEYYNDVATFSDAEYITVTEGNPTPLGAVQLSRGGHITGTVTDASGNALADIAVVAYIRSGAGDWQRWGDNAYTNEAGAYDLARLPSGTYRIWFAPTETSSAWSSGLQSESAEFFDNVTTLEAATDIVVPGEATESGKNAVLTVGGPTTPPPTPIPTPTPTPTPTTSPTTAPTTAPTATPTAVPALTPTQLAAGLGAILGGAKVTGKPAVGKTLRLVGLDASFRTNVAYKIKWFAGKKAIKRATTAKLKLTSAMVGKVISVKVTAISGGVVKTRKIKIGKVK